MRQKSLVLIYDEAYLQSIHPACLGSWGQLPLFPASFWEHRPAEIYDRILLCDNLIDFTINRVSPRVNYVALPFEVLASRFFNLHRDSEPFWSWLCQLAYFSCQMYGYSPWVEFVRALSKFRKRKEFSSVLVSSSIKHETRHFHVVVVQKGQWNVQKSVTHLQSCCFATFSLPSPSYENQAIGGRKVTLYFKCKGKIN